MTDITDMGAALEEAGELQEPEDKHDLVGLNIVFQGFTEIEWADGPGVMVSAVDEESGERLRFTGGKAMRRQLMAVAHRLPLRGQIYQKPTRSGRECWLVKGAE